MSNKPTIKLTKVKSPNAKIQPCGDRILIQPPPPKEEREVIKDGIIVPHSVSNATRIGIEGSQIVVTVLAVGEKCTVVKPGQRIAVNGPNAWECTIDDVKHHFTSEPSVIAIVG